MFDPKKFTINSAKPLPVIFLLDVSSSMSGEKIQNLNKAVEKMLETFTKLESNSIEISVAVMKFGTKAILHIPFTKASQTKWIDLQTDGATSLGGAIRETKKLIESREAIPSRSYRPTVVLVSDGLPTDDWEGDLENFIYEGRSAKCHRMAMALGADADESVLNRFIEGSTELFYANNAGQLHEFFRFVTMTVTTRSQSKTPNEIPPNSQEQRENDEIELGKEDESQGHEDGEEGYW